MDPASFHRAANDWLKEFAVCLKKVSMYSPKHPRGREALERSRELLESLFEERSSLTLTCHEGRLSLENVSVERDRTVAPRIVSDFAARGIRSVEFSAGFGVREYAALVRALLTRPERLAEKGGMDAVLHDEGVSRIAVNRVRAGKGSGAADLLADLSIADALSGAGTAPAEPGGAEAPSAAPDHAAVASALAEAAAQKDRSAPPGNLDHQAEQITQALEQMAQRALAEGRRSRSEILGDLARIVAASPPILQTRLMLPKGGSRHGREALVAAIEQMPAATIAEIVARQQTTSEIEYGRLLDAIQVTSQWREDRQGTIEAIESHLASRGISPSESKEILDHLMWTEIDADRKEQLLEQREQLWRVDFHRVREVLVRLFGADQSQEAITLAQRYLSGLLVEDPAQRRLVAENARHILQLIEKTGKGMPALERIGELFVTRLQDETDPEVEARLSAALAFVADLRLREGETAAVLALMRRADAMAAGPTAAGRERGEGLRQALSRVGNEKLFKELADAHLGGDDAAALEAAEILKHAGSRAVEYLVERLATEEDRARRATLVTLLKEMDRSSIRALTDRLNDPRWFLVRNVIHILGELGDTSVLPAIAESARHSDPRVRKELVATAVKLGGPDGEALVMAACGDPDRSVLLMAVRSLAGLSGLASEDAIAAIIRKEAPFGSADAEMRREAIEAAGLRRLDVAVEPLRDVLRRKGFLGYAESTELRAAAAAALGAIGGEAAMEALAAAAKEDSRREVRAAAAAFLSEEPAKEETTAGPGS